MCICNLCIYLSSTMEALKNYTEIFNFKHVISLKQRIYRAWIRRDCTEWTITILIYAPPVEEPFVLYTPNE